MRFVARSMFGLAILLVSLGDPRAATSPFSDALAVWHMDQASGGRGTLCVEGNVRLGEELRGAEREASLRRGGDARIARFAGGYLRADFAAGRAKTIEGKHMTLYLRLQDSSGRWAAPLFAKDDPRDPYGTIFFGADASLHYIWRTSPFVQRVLGQPSARATYGFNGESNDQHHLVPYQPGQFALSVLTLAEDGAVTVWHNGRKTGGRIDPDRQNLGVTGFRIGAKNDGTEILEGDVAEILVYDRAIADAERNALEALLRSKWGMSVAAASPPRELLPSRGLVLHLDASDTNADGRTPRAGPLDAWIDRSPAGQRFTQAAADRRPELVPDGLAGKPVVRFRGRQWLDGKAVLPAGSRHFTFVAVWRRQHASGSEVIFEQSSPGRGRRACLLTTGGAARSQDAADGVLRLKVPAAVIDPLRWHDVIARFRDANLELFVDGVLVDEEWPHGPLYEFCAPLLIGAGYDRKQLKAGFHGAVDHLAIWNRALADEEIAALAGGTEEVARRDREMFGPRRISAQYWKPRGDNAWAGDCMPFFHEGTFHLFYLFDRRHHGSKWGQGAHQYAHLASRDLIHWEEHPLAVPIARQWECSMGTCDCIWHNGVYRLFYTDCGGRCEYRDKPQRGSWIFCATSTDGIHFRKDFKPLVPGGDCTVFRDPETGLFHLVRGGGNRLVSKDLRNWQEIPGDFVVRKEGTTGECPHLFAWNGWYYFILGTNAIWKSRHALGPWEEMKPAIYDGLFVPKVAEFTGNRRILAGFLFERGWAGHLAFRELVQYPDGSLGTKWPPELIPAAGERIRLSWADVSEGLSSDRRGVRVGGSGSLATAMLRDVPRNVRISFRVAAAGAKRFGVCLRASEEAEGGCELRFEPARQKAQFGRPRHGGLANDSTGRVAAGRDYAIEDVAGLDRPFLLEIVVKDDIVDVCIDRRRTMITRRDPEPLGAGLRLFAEGGEVAFSQIEVRPLK